MATLKEVTAAALRALRGSGFPYALAGGLSANLWVPASSVFATHDVDAAVAISEDDLPGLFRHVERELSSLAALRGDTLEFPRAWIDRFVCPPDITFDIVRSKHSVYAREAMRRTRQVELDGDRFAVLSPEDVILYKSLAARPKDHGPIAAIAAARELDMRYLEEWSRALGTWSFIRKALGLGRRPGNRGQPKRRRRRGR